MKIDRLGRPNHGWSAVNKDRAPEFDSNTRLLMPEPMKRELRKRAKARKCSMAELIRTYITWGLERDFR